MVEARVRLGAKRRQRGAWVPLGKEALESMMRQRRDFGAPLQAKAPERWYLKTNLPCREPRINNPGPMGWPIQW